MNWIKSISAILPATLLMATLSLVPAVGREQSDVSSALNWRLIGPFRGGWATMVTGVPDQPDVFYFGAA